MRARLIPSFAVVTASPTRRNYAVSARAVSARDQIITSLVALLVLVLGLLVPVSR